MEIQMTIEPRKSALIAQIRAAFKGVKREGGITLHEAWAIDCCVSDKKRAQARKHEGDNMSVLKTEEEEEDDFEAEDGVDRWRMTVPLYYRAAKLGWFQNPHVELLDGSVHYKYTGEEFAWKRKEYEQAAQLGWFDGQRVELVKGSVYVKMSQNPPHVNCIEDGGNYLIVRLDAGYRVRRQSPLPLPTDGVPEPDILVVRGSQQDFLSHPRPDEVVLVIEVSDTTLHYDQTLKASLYAEAGLDDYWLPNINNRTMEVRRDPAPMPNQPSQFVYRSLTVYSETDSVAPLALPNVDIPVANLLPPTVASQSDGA